MSGFSKDFSVDRDVFRALRLFLTKQFDAQISLGFDFTMMIVKTYELDEMFKYSILQKLCFATQTFYNSNYSPYPY